MAAEQLMLAVPLKPVQSGEEFAKFPPHITWSPWVEVDSSQLPALSEELREVFSLARRPIVTVGEPVLFGENETIPARRFEATAEYNLIVDFPTYAAAHGIMNAYARQYDGAYMGLSWNSHTSKTPLEEKQRIVLPDAALFQKGASTGVKRVIETFPWRTPNDQTTT